MVAIQGCGWHIGQEVRMAMFILNSQVEVENYTGACDISGESGVGSLLVSCDIEVQRSGDRCLILLRDASGVIFGKIAGVALGDFREEPEGALHWDRSIPDDKTRHC